MSKIGVDIEADVSGLDQGLAKAEKRVGEFSGTVSKATQDLASASSKASAALTESSDAAVKLLDKYDPLGAQLRRLKEDFKALDAAAHGGGIGSRDDARLDAVYTNLQREIKASEVAIKTFGTGGSAAMGEVTAATERGLFATQASRRELAILAREAVSGNFSQMPGTFMVLAQRANLSTAALLGVGGAVAATVVGFGALAVAAVQGHREMAAMNTAIEMTGNFSGTTNEQMRSLASAMSAMGTATIGQSKEVITALVGSGKIGAQALAEVASLAENYAHATGTEIDKIAPELVRLFSDPVKGAEELNQQLHFLTVAEQEYIAELWNSGRAQEAQLVLAEKLRDHTPKHVEQLGQLERAWVDVTKAASSAWDRMLGVGRPKTLSEEIAEIKEQLRTGSLDFAQDEGQVRAMLARKEAQQITDDAKNKADQAAADKNREMAAVWGMTKGVKSRQRESLQMDIGRLEAYSATGSDDERGRQMLAVEEAIFKKKKEIADLDKTPKVAAPKADEYEKLINRLSGLDGNYGKELDTLYGAYQKGRVGLDEYSASVELLIQKQPFATRAAQEDKKAREEQAKVLEVVGRADEHAAKAMSEFIIKSDERVEAVTRSIELLGKTPEQAALINAFADIDRAAEAARVKIEQVLGAKGDTDGIDHMVGQLQRLTELLKGKTAAALDEHKRKQDELNASWEYGADQALEKYLREVGNVAAQSERLFGRAFASMEDALSKFVQTGKLDFASLTQSIISDLIKMEVQASITGPLAASMKASGGIGGFFGQLFGGGDYAAPGTSDLGPTMGSWFGSAKGNVFSGAPDLHQYVNTVQTSPKVFGFDRLHAYAKGGIFAEENPEAVMPLARDGQGRLGVRSQGGSGGLVVNITNNGAADGYQARATTRENDGQSVIEIVFEKVRGMMVDDARRNGPVTQAFGNTFGLSRQAF